MTNITLTTVVFFRTEANGSYRWMRDLKPGHYRLQDVQDTRGSMAIHSRNVVRVRETTGSGILGTTARSRYYLGDQCARLWSSADGLNRQRDAEFARRTHRAE